MFDKKKINQINSLKWFISNNDVLDNINLSKFELLENIDIENNTNLVDLNINNLLNLNSISIKDCSNLNVDISTNKNLNYYYYK